MKGRRIAKAVPSRLRPVVLTGDRDASGARLADGGGAAQLPHPAVLWAIVSGWVVELGLTGGGHLLRTRGWNQSPSGAKL